MWQALHTELEPAGVTIVTVALDSDPTLAHPWIDAAAPTHPSLIDRAHSLGPLLGFVNVPMAVWIDEQGVLVRPPEAANVQPNGLKGRPLPEGLPDRILARLELVAEFPGDHEAYLSAVRDWAVNGDQSRFALTPDEVVKRSLPRSADEARAAACFELGEHLFELEGQDSAAPWWREAHRLQPSNWTYKRQAWSLATTKPGEPSDLIQEPTELYVGNWLDDLVAQGGPSQYTTAFSGPAD